LPEPTSEQTRTAGDNIITAGALKETLERWLKERGPPTSRYMAGKFPGGSPTE